MKKTYSVIAIGSLLSLLVAASPAVSYAESSFDDRFDDLRIGVGAGVKASVNGNARVNRDHGFNDDADSSARGNKNVSKKVRANGNAYGHIIAPGYIKNFGTTSANGLLPPGIAKKIDGDRGHGSTTTGTTTRNLPPVIDSISGSTTVTADEAATWTINASDPESGPLMYRASFGDSFWARALWFWHPFVSSPTFTHAYDEPGTYKARFSVKDERGSIATRVVTITVNASPAATTTPSLSGVSAAVLASTSVQMNWKTDIAADSQVHFGTTSPVVIGSATASSTTDASLTTDHQVTLNGLSASTTYYMIVKSETSAGLSATSSQFFLTTLGL